MFILFITSCASYHYADYSKTLIKGSPIGTIYIFEYKFEHLDTNTQGYGIIPKDSIYDLYFIESDYYKELIESKYIDIQNQRSCICKSARDSLIKYYPEKNKLSTLNVLNDSILKFRKSVEDWDNFRASKESYSIKQIIKPNHFYRIAWDKGKSDRSFEDGVKEKDSSKHWLEFIVDEKRNIISWVEVKRKQDGIPKYTLTNCYW